MTKNNKKGVKSIPKSVHSPSRFKVGQTASWMVSYGASDKFVKVSGMVKECRYNKEGEHCYLLRLITGDLVVKDEKSLLR